MMIIHKEKGCLCDWWRRVTNKLKLLGLKTWVEVVTLAADRTTWRMETTNMHWSQVSFKGEMDDDNDG